MISMRALMCVAASLLASCAMAQSVPNGGITAGQVWSAQQWNSAWASKLDDVLAQGQIFVGQGSNQPGAVTLSGDCALSVLGALTCTKTNGVAFGSFATQNYTTPPAIGVVTPNIGNFSSILDTSNAGVTASCAYFDTAGLLHGTGSACGSGAGTVNSVFGRTGVVTAQTGDYTASQISGLGTSATVNTGTTGATIPLLNAATNYWGGYQVGCWNINGCLSPRNGVVFQAVAPTTGADNTPFDAFAYNFPVAYAAERADYSGGSFTGVGAYESIGGYFGAARTSSGGDPTDAGIEFFTTEAQTSTNNGMAAVVTYTPNGSTALSDGLFVSPQGLGGVVVGGSYNGSAYSGPTDLGAGTVNANSDVKTAGHFRSGGTAPTVSACGSGPSVTGTDNAGTVTIGGGTTCTLTFAHSFNSPVCIVQVKNNPPGNFAAYVSALSATSMTIATTSSLTGGVFYICQDAG